MLTDQALFVAREGGGDVGNHKISGVRYGRGISCRQQNAKVGLNISHLDSRQKASTAATVLN